MSISGFGRQPIPFSTTSRPSNSKKVPHFGKQAQTTLPQEASKAEMPAFPMEASDKPSEKPFNEILQYLSTALSDVMKQKSPTPLEVTTTVGYSAVADKKSANEPVDIPEESPVAHNTGIPSEKHSPEVEPSSKAKGNVPSIKSSLKLLNADKNLTEKFRLFEDQLGDLRKKSFTQRVQDYFTGWMTPKRPSEFEQSTHNILEHFELVQDTLDKMHGIGQNPLLLAKLRRKHPERLEDMAHVLREATTTIRSEIGKIQAKDRENKTFLQQQLYGLSLPSVRALHQFDRALENYQEAADELINA